MTNPAGIDSSIVIRDDNHGGDDDGCRSRLSRPTSTPLAARVWAIKSTLGFV